MNKLLSFGADIPVSIQDDVNLLKLTSCYCEGKFCGGSIETLLRNFPSVFTDEVCSFFFPEIALKGLLADYKSDYIEFNTLCLAQCYMTGQNGEIVRKLIDCGADSLRAKQIASHVTRN